jgi:hypothetical protein
MASEARYLCENKAHETHVAKIVEELTSVIDSAEEGEYNHGKKTFPACLTAFDRRAASPEMGGDLRARSVADE